MARPIETIDAKRIIATHRELLAELAETQGYLDSLRSEIKKASDALVAQEVLGILKGIPIDEINRENRGFRIKALHDNGYHTIADIAAASVYTISSIHGISEDTAYSIKRVVDKIVSTTRRSAKIRLSEDNCAAIP